jgi:hypothetical protein
MDEETDRVYHAIETTPYGFFAKLPPTPAYKRLSEGNSPTTG